MTTGESANPAAPPPAAPSVFLPREHGSWSLALEPALLGVLAAPSAAGAAVALAAASALLCRRPLRACLEPEAHPRRRGPRLALAALGGAAAAFILEALALAGPAPLWPLVPAGALGALFLAFDLRRGGRAAAAEIAGGAAFGLLPAAIASAAGWGAPAALALSAAMLARTVPTVLTVRAYLRLARGRPAGPALPVLSAGLALLGVAALSRLGLVPWAAPALAAVLLARTICVFTPLRPAWTARRVGFTEAGLGLGYVAALGLAYGAWAGAFPGNP